MSKLSKIVGINEPQDNPTIAKLLAKYVEEGPVIHNPNEFVGIEIEIENVGYYPDQFRHIWEMKEDGSLRNGGREFISYPIRGVLLSKCIDLFYKNIPHEWSFSPRTSIHIHLNMLDCDVSTIARTVLLYILFERVLYRFIGHDRDKSIFCVPIQDTFRVLNIFKDFKTTLEKGGAFQNQDTRYTGLNLASLNNFGTLEFRQLHGTRDVKLLGNWINILMALKNYALNITEQQLIRRVIDLNTNSQYLQFADEVFGRLFTLFDRITLSQDMSVGVKSVKFGILSDTFLKELMAIEPTKLVEWSTRNKKKVRKLIPPRPVEEVGEFNIEWVVPNQIGQPVAAPANRELNQQEFEVALEAARQRVRAFAPFPAPAREGGRRQR